MINKHSRPTRETVEKLVKDMDTNGDNNLDRDEFRQLLKLICGSILLKILIQFTILLALTPLLSMYLFHILAVICSWSSSECTKYSYCLVLQTQFFLLLENFRLPDWASDTFLAVLKAAVNFIMFPTLMHYSDVFLNFISATFVMDKNKKHSA